jgi:hypothetical protein
MALRWLFLLEEQNLMRQNLASARGQVYALSDTERLSHIRYVGR